MHCGCFARQLLNGENTFIWMKPTSICDPSVQHIKTQTHEGPAALQHRLVRRPGASCNQTTQEPCCWLAKETDSIRQNPFRSKTSDG